MTELVAIIDIGKTHAMLVFVEAHSGREVWSARRASSLVETPLDSQLGVAAMEQWLFRALRNAPLIHDVTALVPIAHGAAAVLVDTNGDVVAAPDYESRRFERVNAAYERERDAFDVTLSPSLPGGLNLGRQLLYLETCAPEMFSRTAHLLLYPQYWAWLFSGVMASEVTSLGCHSDLWRPREATFSALARAHGWDRILPGIRLASDTLGTVTPKIAAATGLDSSCRVLCGIHDSNASYLQHLMARERDQPFAVISSGTWTVVMAHRADLSRLRAERDMLANVDAFGSPVATARFMGGREYEAIAQSTEHPDIASLARVLQRRAYAFPSFANAGPFPAAKGELIRAHLLNGAERAALASLYTALMSDLLIESLGATGDVLVDGPLASDPLFASLLATWRPGIQVLASTSVGGICAHAATYLAGFATPAEQSLAAAPLDLPGLDTYRQTWREQLPR